MGNRPIAGLLGLVERDSEEPLGEILKGVAVPTAGREQPGQNHHVMDGLAAGSVAEPGQKRQVEVEVVADDLFVPKRLPYLSQRLGGKREQVEQVGEAAPIRRIASQGEQANSIQPPGQPGSFAVEPDTRGVVDGVKNHLEFGGIANEAKREQGKKVGEGSLEKSTRRADNNLDGKRNAATEQRRRLSCREPLRVPSLFLSSFLSGCKSPCATF